MCCEKYLDGAYPGTVLTGGRRHLNKRWLYLSDYSEVGFSPPPFKSSLFPPPPLLLCGHSHHLNLELSIFKGSDFSEYPPQKALETWPAFAVSLHPKFTSQCQLCIPPFPPISLPIVASEILPTSFPSAWIPWRSAVSVDDLLQTFFWNPPLQTCLSALVSILT